jgi:8-amino-7-oxononanoate synthase
MELPQKLKKRLENASSLNQYRSLKPRHGIDFTSNDYLGFTQDKNLLEILKKNISELTHLGSSGSRLLRGNLEIFEVLENDLAKFSKRKASLFFPSGFQANLALYSALLTADDVVFSDEYNHASIIDGIRLSRCKCEIYPHGDFQTLAKILMKYEKFQGLKVIATESLFSMEGDRASVKELAKLSLEHGALLVIDEAHSTGLYDCGEGAFATLHTGGKALGVAGAWIACDPSFKDFLVNFSRPFIFSTAPQPVLAQSLRASLKYWSQVGEARVTKLLKNSQYFLSKINQRSSDLKFSIPLNILGPIIPIILGENERALKVALQLEKRGYDVRAIRPPTVPEGTARLRLTLNSEHSEKILDQFIENFFNILEKLK